MCDPAPRHWAPRQILCGEVDLLSAGLAVIWALNTLHDRGIMIMRRHTRADNARALPLYQSVGFQMLKAFPHYRKLLDWEHHAEISCAYCGRRP